MKNWRMNVFKSMSSSIFFDFCSIRNFVDVNVHFYKSNLSTQSWKSPMWNKKLNIPLEKMVHIISIEGVASSGRNGPEPWPNFHGVSPSPARIRHFSLWAARSPSNRKPECMCCPWIIHHWINRNSDETWSNDVILILRRYGLDFASGMHVEQQI